MTVGDLIKELQHWDSRLDCFVQDYETGSFDPVTEVNIRNLIKARTGTIYESQRKSSKMFRGVELET